MFRAATVSLPADTFSSGRSSPNTFELEHVSEPFASIRLPETVLPASDAMLSPPAMIRLRIW